MINTNTKKKTNVSTGVKTESEIYLKKSELPKNVSSFSNDAGYISKSALDTWLKNHNYIPKSEINTLISNANLVVVDSINKQYDEDAINRLNNYIKDIKGEIVAIKDRLNKVEGDYISIEKGSSFATKTDISKLTNTIRTIENNYITIDDIPSLPENIATQEWVESKGYITSADLPGEFPDMSIYAKKSQLNDYAKKTWVEEQGYLKEHQDISGKVDRSELGDYVKNNVLNTALNKYAKKTDIPDISGLARVEDIPSVNGLVTETDLNNKLSGYVKTNTLNKYATKSWVNNTLGDYVKKNDLSLDEYATQEWVEGQGYLKDVDMSSYVTRNSLSTTLGNYAKQTNVYTKVESDNRFLSKEDASSTYPTKADVKNTYLSKKDAESIYLQIEDYIGLRDEVVISDEYANKSFEAIKNDVYKLVDGFYIVQGHDIVIIKDHKVNQIFKDGTPTRELVWEIVE